MTTTTTNDRPSAYALGPVKSPRHLSEILGVPQRTAENWMSGRRPMPLSAFNALVQTCGTSNATTAAMLHELTTRRAAHGRDAWQGVAP